MSTTDATRARYAAWYAVLRIPLRALVSLLVLLVVLIPAACDQPDRVVIGVALSSIHRPGAIMAMEEINAAGGIDGSPLELAGLDWVSVPDDYDPRESIAWAKRFVEIEDLLAVIGPGDSSSTLASAPVYNKQQVPQIVTTATNPSIIGIGDWTYRLCLSDAIQGPALADYAIDQWDKHRFAVLYVADEYGQRLASLFQGRVEERGGEVLVSVPHHNLLAEGDRRLIRHTFENLSENDFSEAGDAIVLIQRGSAAAWTAEELARYPITTSILASDSIGTLGNAALITSLGFELRTSVFFRVDPQNELALSFVQRWRKRFGEEPSGFQAYAYDAVFLVRDAVIAGGASRSGVKRALDQLIRAGVPQTGVTGPFLFGRDHDARRPVIIGIARNGSFQSFDTIDPAPMPEG